MNTLWIFRSWSVVLMLSLTILLTACVTGPKIRSDLAPDANLTQYQTFGFMQELATDRAGYTSLVTQHLKAAVSAEMIARGFRYSEDAPALLINFNSNVEQRADIRTTTSSSLPYHGYYHYRLGYYSPFPYYQKEVETVRYQYGTVNIDVVDAARKQLLWEGIAEGVLKEQDIQQPRESMARVVNQIFSQFPIQR